MKDFIGNELKIGDAVATNRDGYTWSLEKVYVVGFTPQKIRLSYKKDEEKGVFLKYPRQVVKI